MLAVGKLTQQQFFASRIFLYILLDHKVQKMKYVLQRIGIRHFAVCIYAFGFINILFDVFSDKIVIQFVKHLEEAKAVECTSKHLREGTTGICIYQKIQDKDGWRAFGVAGSMFMSLVPACGTAFEYVYLVADVVGDKRSFLRSDVV